MTHPHERFSGTVDAYIKYRPSYPEVMVDWIVDQARLVRGDVVVDVGCGTGIAARLFAGRGLRVIGVDPNSTMLAEGRNGGGNVEYLVGAAEELPLDDNFAEGAVSGQAFHWFDLDQAIQELGRVLRPGRTCTAFWNIRDHSTPFLKEYEQALCRHCPEYPVASAVDTIERIRDHGQVAHVREKEFTQGQTFDREELLGRAWSSSYVVHGVRDADGFNRDLVALFERHQIDGTVEFRYRTLAVAFEPAMRSVRSVGA
jgi:SAM-dependent methyltransferase